MTITAQIASIRQHPYYQLALTSPECMERLLFEVMFHTYTVASLNSYKGYRAASAAGLNRPQIIEAIRDAEPPTNLDLKLPTPTLEEMGRGTVCVVTELPRTKKSRRAVMDCRQLALWA